jgi:hypothetical protein
MTCTFYPSRPLAAALLYGAAAALIPGMAALAAPASGSETSAPVSPVRQVEAAAEMADLGRAMRDPVLLIAAARAVIASEAQGPAASDATDPWSVDVLLAEASTLAGADQSLQGIIQETALGQHRGVLTGPSQIHEIIKPSQVQRFAFTFAARERADAVLRIKPGGEGAVLSLEAIDDRRRRVAITTTPAQFNHAAYVAWAPQHCGGFTIIVRNSGTVPAAYRLSTAPSQAGVEGCQAIATPATQRRSGNRK